MVLIKIEADNFGTITVQEQKRFYAKLHKIFTSKVMNHTEKWPRKTLEAYLINIFGLISKRFFFFSFFFWNTSIWCTINDCASIDNAGFFVFFTTLDMIWPIWPIWFVIQTVFWFFTTKFFVLMSLFTAKDKNNWNY